MRIHAGSTGDNVDGRQQRRETALEGTGQLYAAAAGSTSNIDDPGGLRSL